MDDIQASRILSALANGTDPNTGEIYPPDSPYQSPEVVRALFLAIRTLQDRKNPAANQSLSHASNPSPNPSSSPARQGAASARHPAGANVGKNWSNDEDQKLLAAFDAGKSLSELAQMHGRTQNGVRARLEKHGRLEPSPATRWPVGRSNANGNGSQGNSRANQ